VRRPIMQRGEENAGQGHDQCAEPDDDSVDIGFELDPKRLQVRPDKVQVLLRGNVIMDRVEPPGGQAHVSWPPHYWPFRRSVTRGSVAIRSAFWRSMLASARAFVSDSRSVKNCASQCTQTLVAAASD
jgi:hypothetical protein